MSIMYCCRYKLKHALEMDNGEVREFVLDSPRGNSRQQLLDSETVPRTLTYKTYNHFNPIHTGVTREKVVRSLECDFWNSLHLNISHVKTDLVQL